jgi:Bacterial Ig-like domain (group 3)/Glycine rich protein
MRVSVLPHAVRTRRLTFLACASLAGAALPVTGLIAGPAGAANSPVCTYGATTATCTFAYSATSYTWTVPAGVNTLSVIASGGSGQGVGNTSGGAGGVVAATLTGTGGQTLIVSTGGAGSGTAGGNGGGGTGGSGSTNGGGGGGATVISAVTTLVVAGGGGGSASGNSGGNGGGSSAALSNATTGGNGSSAAFPFSTGGGGGSTLVAMGGAAGQSPICSGGVTPGRYGAGGNGVNCTGASAGGGGGGGFYGGGGGGNSSGGGGGSSFPAIPLTNVLGITVTPGSSAAANFGNGSAVITYALKTTTTTLNPTPNPSTQGQSVALVATVSPTDGNGTVSFYNGGIAITGCTNVPITNMDQASCSTSTLPAGTNVLTAGYSGDPYYGSSVSNPVQQVVLIPTTTTLTSRPNPSSYGENVRFTATVSPNDGGGSVTFKNGGTPIAGCAGLPLTQTDGSYQATCDTSTLPVGTDPIIAVYSGDTDYAASPSNIVDQVVSPARSSLRAAGSLNARGDIYVSARLTASGAPLSGQLITFTAGPGVMVCTATTGSNGIATCEASPEGGVMIALSQGVFTAAYTGSTDDSGSRAIGIVYG